MLESAQRKNLQKTHSCLAAGWVFCVQGLRERQFAAVAEGHPTGNERRSEAVEAGRGRHGSVGRSDQCYSLVSNSQEYTMNVKRR